MKMAAMKNKSDDDNLKILREIMTIGNNRSCFDCGQRGPTYVNTTIGSFVCTSCSGILRGLNPPHRVKSISMATFTSEEIDFIRSRGNNFCRKVWLGKQDSPIHSQSSSLEEGQLMADLMLKYEKKRWYIAPTDEMYEEARRLNTSGGPVKRTEATLLSQMTASRSIPNISTQSIQRPTPGNVRSVAGMPHINPTSSLPQSPIKFSPQTPKTTIAPSPWGVQESPNAFSPPANFADFASFDSSTQQQSFVTSVSSPGPILESFQSPGSAFRPPVPSDRYAALAELDSTRGTAFFPDSFKWDLHADSGGATRQHPQVSSATNPFMIPASASVFPSQPCSAVSNQFVHINSAETVPAFPAGVYSPYMGIQQQPGELSGGAIWSSTSEAFPRTSQMFPSAANPFLNMTRQNTTNPFL